MTCTSASSDFDFQQETSGSRVVDRVGRHPSALFHSPFLNGDGYERVRPLVVATMPHTHNSKRIVVCRSSKLL